MPDDIDWPGIRAAAAAVGVRKAARQAGRNLPADEQERFVHRVLKRSQREGWVTAVEEAKALAEPQGLPMSSIVLKGSDVLKESLAEDSKETKLSLSRTFRKAAKHAETLEGDKLLDRAQDLKIVTQGTALVHSWDEGKGAQVSINLLIQ